MQLLPRNEMYTTHLHPIMNEIFSPRPLFLLPTHPQHNLLAHGSHRPRFKYRDSLMKGNGKWTFFSIYSVPGTMLNMFMEMISFNPHHGPVKREPQFPLFLESSICRSWCWKRLKAEKEEGDKGWDGLMASLIQWTWTRAHSGRRWGMGKLGVLQSMGLQRIKHDWGLSDWTFSEAPTAGWRSHRLYGTRLGLNGQTHFSYCLSCGWVLKLLSSSTEVLPR